MSEKNIADWLAKAIQVTKQGAGPSFHCTGVLPNVACGLQIKGIGTIKFPIKPKDARALMVHGQPAPFGKGEQTLIDPSVRKTCEFEPEQFQCSAEWDKALNKILPEIATQLGLPTDSLEAHPYKLLVYQKGDFFLPHKDSEKLDRMVASLIVVLPNRFDGGGLRVEHEGKEVTYSFPLAGSAKNGEYVAFYADCTHEVQRVKSGVRICLAYNLTLAKPNPGMNKQPRSVPSPVERLAERFKEWTTKRPREPLVVALSHHYSEKGLKIDLLKGADRTLADLVVSAAEQAGCCLHLAQVSRYTVHDTFDGYSRRMSGYSRVGDLLVEELELVEWRTVGGKPAPIGKLTVAEDSIICSEPLERWKPTREEHEGYTGNAGNELSRWYHRSAITVVSSDDYYSLVANSGMEAAIRLFGLMAKKLEKTSQKKLPAARADCRKLALAVIDNWPTIGSYYRREPPDYDVFLQAILLLADADVIGQWIAVVGRRDVSHDFTLLARTTAKEFGFAALREPLSQLCAPVLLPPPHRYSKYRVDTTPEEPGIPARLELFTAKCIADLSCRPSNDADRETVCRELSLSAVARFIAHVQFEGSPQNRMRSHHATHPRSLLVQEEAIRKVTASDRGRILSWLIQSLAAFGLDETFGELLEFVQADPNAFTLEQEQVPALVDALPRIVKRSGTPPAELIRWFEQVRAELESGLAREPTPSPNWNRPAEVTCNSSYRGACQQCQELNAFLADSDAQVGEIRARGDLRAHIQSQINQFRCDVTTKEKKDRSPYALVLTKGDSRYHYETIRYQNFRLLLDALPEIG